MTVYNNGTIVLKDNLTLANLVGAKAVFNSSYQVNISPYEVEGVPYADIVVEDLTGDLNDELIALCDFCKTSGMTIVDGDIRYYGDYDGSYQYNKESQRFDEYSAEETAILDASDEQLIDELKHRGYDVMKKAESLNSGYVQAVTFQEV